MRVLLVDDHALFREGIAMLLASLGPTESVLEAGSVETALALLSRGETIDLVLMDLALPGMSGLDGIARLKLDHPGLPVVALSSSDDRESVLAALDAGAMGYIPKSASSGVLMGALKLVMANGIYLPPSAFIGVRNGRARRNAVHRGRQRARNSDRRRNDEFGMHCLLHRSVCEAVRILPVQKWTDTLG
jgi:DNA-binding NarL/FixJ family response regulator